jgi:hypothetical protein
MDAVPGRRRTDGSEDRCPRFLRFVELFRLSVQVTADLPTTAPPAYTFRP